MKKLSVGIAGFVSTVALFAGGPAVSVASARVRAHDTSTDPTLSISTGATPNASGECKYEAMPNPGTALHIRKTPSTNADIVGNYAYGDAVFATCDYTYANGYDWVYTDNSPSQTQGWVNLYYLLPE